MAPKRKTRNEAGPSDEGREADDQVRRLCDIVERFLERDIRQGTDIRNAPPPPPRAENMENVGERFQRLKPPTFEGGIETRVAENWLRTIERSFSYGRIPDEAKVSCATFYLRDAASFWWDTMVAMHDVASMSWERFKELFEDKYISKTARVDKRREFVNLKQGDMAVDQYIQKFEELSRYAPSLVSTEELKVEQFVEGLRPEIYRDVAVGQSEGQTFARVAEQALRAERAQKRIKEEREKRFPPKQGFQQGQRSGQPGNKGQRRNNQGWQGKPNSQPKGTNGNGQGQGQKDIQRPPCSKCGKPHTGVCRAGTGTCYRCGKEGHFVRDCNATIQEQKKATARVFALSRAEAEANPSVVSGNIFISGTPTHVIIDSGATHSFASKNYASKLGKPLDDVNVRYTVSLPSGKTMDADQALRGCCMRVDGRELFVDLVVLDMPDYEVILGMDWLSKYNANIDCRKKVVTFRPPGEEEFLFAGTTQGLRTPVISAMKARRLLDSGCVGYLASVVDKDSEKRTSPDSISVV